MRLLSIFLFATAMNVYASGAAQSVTFSGKGVSLKKVFSVIKEQTGYHVFFKAGFIDETRPVSVNASNMPLKAFLEMALKEQGLTYSIQSKTITLLKIPEIAFAPEILSPPTIAIAGKVTDIDNNPMEGATITVPGTRIATVTDVQGRFHLNNIPERSRIVISSVGFAPITLLVNGSIVTFNAGEKDQNKTGPEETEGNTRSTARMEANGSVHVQLARLVKTIETVVITGMFQRNINNYTGASKTISGSELKTMSANNVFAAISAIDPSFRILPNNIVGGNINQLPELQMRGQNSFPNLSGELSNNPNAPLFILDGFEVNLQRIVDLDQNLINSVTLLKDASATAIYGSRGANGVMVFTTLAPKPGKLQVTVTNDFRYTTPDLSVYNLLNATEKLDFEKRAGVYTDNSSQFFQYIADYKYNLRLQSALSGINTNWKSFATQNGTSNRTSLYLQGGDNAIRYGLQMAGDLQTGVMKGQNRKNYSAQFDLQYQVKKFQFKNSIRVYQNHSNESPYGDFSKYLGMNPYWTPFDEQGKIKKNLEDFTILSNRRFEPNPLYDASLHSVNRQKYFGFTNNFSMRYNVAQNLFVESNFSLTRQEGTTDQFYAAEDSRFNSIADPNQKGSYTVRSDQASGYESLTTLNYNFSRGRNRLFNTLGFNLASNTSSYYSIVTQGFPFDRLDNLLFAAQYQANGRPSGDESSVRRVGMLYSGNYSYDDRFLADLSVRKDGSSQFGTDKRFGNFWAAGIGWNLHNERFFRKNNIVNRLKIRASYGSTGSLNIPAYSAQFRYGFGVGTSYYNELGATLSGLGNENLSWQNVYKQNIGADMVLFKEKLDIRVDVYKENTKNTLTQVTLAPSTGFPNYSENLGEVENRGFEFAVRYKVIQNNSKGLLWTVNVNGFTNSNILKKLSNKLKASNDKLDASNTDQVQPNTLLREGQSLNAIYVVPSLGVDPVTGSEVFLTKEGKHTFVWNAADKVPYGISQPKWNGNFGTTVAYSGFDINMVFNYQFGGQLYNQTLASRVESVDPTYNVDRRAYDLGWKKPGDNAQFTRIGLSKEPTKLTSRFVQDDNNIILSSASLGYNFYRSRFLEKIRLSSLQLRFITNDLFRVSSIRIERGTSNPFARTYSLTIRAGF